MQFPPELSATSVVLTDDLDRTVSASDRWLGLGNVRQVLVLSSVLIITSFASLGFWVSHKIESSIKIDVGLRAGTYLEAALTEILQPLEQESFLSAGEMRSIDQILSRDLERLDVAEARIWRPDGKVLFSTSSDAVGRTYILTEDMLSAISGEIGLDFDMEPHGDDPFDITRTGYFEVYAPIFGRTTGKVIAVAEFYQNGTAVVNAVRAARIETWIMTSIACMGLIAGIIFVVIKSDKLITSQRDALDRQVAGLVELLAQNEELRLRLGDASQRGTEDYEAVLRRIGADLHDGVGQLLALVVLRLSTIFTGPAQNMPDYIAVKTLLDECLTEIRQMAVGLALPEIKSLSLFAAITLVVRRHERRTGTKVDLSFNDVEVEPGHPVRLGICRMIQEGLTNAFKHAGGIGQAVCVTCSPTHVVVRVSDRGPGIVRQVEPNRREGLGLTGLRNRLSSLGGLLTIRSSPDSGTVLNAHFPLYRGV